jgi:hypothetical protein
MIDTREKQAAGSPDTKAEGADMQATELYRGADARSLPSKIGHHVASAALAIVTVSAIFFAIAWDRRPPIHFTDVSVIPEVAAPGADVNVAMELTYDRLCQGQASRSIVASDGTIHPYIGHPLHLPNAVGGDQYRDIPFKLPEVMSAGRATYHGSVSFNDCGWTSRLYPIVVATPDVSLTIVPNVVKSSIAD